jgi:hypothetical protein
MSRVYELWVEKRNGDDVHLATIIGAPIDVHAATHGHDVRVFHVDSADPLVPQFKVPQQTSALHGLIALHFAEHR